MIVAVLDEGARKGEGEGARNPLQGWMIPRLRARR